MTTFALGMPRRLHRLHRVLVSNRHAHISIIVIWLELYIGEEKLRDYGTMLLEQATPETRESLGFYSDKSINVTLLS